MLIIGTRLFFWGSLLTSYAMHCGRCGYQGPFALKKGMRFITVFFIIPVIPISGVMHVAECQQCKTRYKANVNQAAPQQNNPVS
jgi:hypothetical protein